MLFTSALFAALAALNVVSAMPATTNTLSARAFNPEKACPPQGPFALKINSKSKTYDGKYITGTHIGAGIDLAVTGKLDKHYYLNYTSYSYSTTPGSDVPVNVSCYYGVLAYQAIKNIPLQGGLSINLSSNIAQLWLSVLESLPGAGVFEFNKKKELTLNGESHWYGCKQGFEGYGPFPAIAWQLGSSGPSDKSCVPITIVKA